MGGGGSFTDILKQYEKHTTTGEVIARSYKERLKVVNGNRRDTLKIARKHLSCDCLIEGSVQESQDGTAKGGGLLQLQRGILAVRAVRLHRLL